MLTVDILNVVVPNVIMLSVVAPFQGRFVQFLSMFFEKILFNVLVF